MMSEMIERVARAIGTALMRQDIGSADEVDQLPNPSGLDENLCAAYLDQGEVDMGIVARAVLEAMREPTEAMLNAWASAPKVDKWRSQAAGDWQAMIDAALK